MMRLIYPICCGLDVHKKVIVATIVTTNSSGISEYHQKSFATIILTFRTVNMSTWNPLVSIARTYSVYNNISQAGYWH